MPNWKLHSTTLIQKDVRRNTCAQHDSWYAVWYVCMYIRTYIHMYILDNAYTYTCMYLSWVLGIYLHDKRSVCPERLVCHLHIRSADGIFTRVVEEVLVHPGMDLKGIGINKELCAVCMYAHNTDRHTMPMATSLEEYWLCTVHVRIQVYQIVVTTHIQ